MNSDNSFSLIRLIQKYFDEISQDTGRYCFGVEDTLRGLEMGAVETLIVWENLDVTRHTLRTSLGTEVIVHTHAPPPTASNAKVDGQTGINALSEKDRAKMLDSITGLEMEQASEPMNLLEWFSEKYKEFGAELEFVTNRLVYFKPIDDDREKLADEYSHIFIPSFLEVKKDLNSLKVSEELEGSVDTRLISVKSLMH